MDDEVTNTGIIDALQQSQCGRAHLVNRPIGLGTNDLVQAKLVPVDDDVSIIEVSFSEEGEWSPFDELPVPVQARLIAADWVSVDPKHPLSWLAEQFDEGA